MNAFIISGGSSNTGKTLISLGIMNAFSDVAPFKVGPDFIDPTFHSRITENQSYNLDLFLMGEEGVNYSFGKHLKKINIIEGVMGLYDGIDNSMDNNSTAHLSRVLDVPVVLIIDGKGKGISIAGEILGYKKLDERVNILGVIINRVNENRYDTLKNDIEKLTGVKCIGYLPQREEYNLESRHLGLIQAHEVSDLKYRVDFLTKELKKTLDLDYILKKSEKEIQPQWKLDPYKHLENSYKNLRIGVAMDEAFTFYYDDNFDIFKRMGIEIVPFSPIRDSKIPDVHMLYFGGGYPENFLEELSENRSMISSIKEFNGKNQVIFAECGGFIYLSQGIFDSENNFYTLCNIFSCSMKLYKRLDISRFGYVEIDFKFSPDSEVIKTRGHEFHYSRIEEIGDEYKAYGVSKRSGKSWQCGYMNNKSIGGYPHINFIGNIDFLRKILEEAQDV